MSLETHGSSGVQTSPNRIVHVVKRYVEISQTFVADAVTETDRLGWQAWVATRGLANRGVFPFPPLERILIGRRPSAIHRVLGRAAGHSAPERRAQWLAGQVEQVAPDVIHAHFGWMGLDALPIAERVGTPLLVSFHATDVTVDPHAPGQARHYRRLLARLDRATAVSGFIEGKLRALGFTGPVDRLPAGVRLERFPFRGPRRLNGDVRLLFVGRQVPRKGLDVLLRALPQIVPAEREVRLDVIGDGPARAASEALARELGVAGRVAFHGAQPPEVVTQALASADVLVVPSRTSPDGEAEGSPVITKEALAVGVPIVASRNGGTAETIPPAYRHELIPEDDHQALAARVSAVIDQHERWPERVRVGRRWVEQQFDWDVLARRLAAIYEDLAQSAR